MSPASYDPKAVVAGPSATLTMAGLAVGLSAGFVQPVYAWVAGGAGVLLAATFFALAPKQPKVKPFAHLGVGLVVGVGLYFALTALGILGSHLATPQ